MPRLNRTPICRSLTGHTPAPQLRGYDLITSGSAGISCTPTAAIVGGAR